MFNSMLLFDPGFLAQEVSHRLLRFARRAVARPEDWSCADLADADFLSSLQLDCAQQLAEVSRSFKARDGDCAQLGCLVPGLVNLQKAMENGHL